MIVILDSTTSFNDSYFVYAKDSLSDKLCVYVNDDSTSLITIPQSNIVTEIPQTFNQCCLNNLQDAYYSISELQLEFAVIRPSKVQQLRDNINEIRNELCLEPIVYNVGGVDYTFKADAISQQDITDATLQAMAEGQSFEKTWVAEEGYVVLHYDDIIGLKYAIGLRRQSFVYESTVMKQVLEALSYEQLCMYEIEFTSY